MLKLYTKSLLIMRFQFINRFFEPALPSLMIPRTVISTIIRAVVLMLSSSHYMPASHGNDVPIYKPIYERLERVFWIL